MVKLLAEMKVQQTSNGNYDLTKLSREQYIKFRYYFVERRMDHPVWIKNSRAKVMELLLNAVCMIFCKKVPTDIGVTKIDQLHNRVKLLAPVAQTQQKPHGAVLRLTPATRVLTAIELEEQAADDDHLYKHFDEVDQDNKAIALCGRTKELSYNVTVIN